MNVPLNTFDATLFDNFDAVEHIWPETSIQV